MQSNTRMAFAALPLTLGLLLAAPASATDITEVSKDDFHGYSYYQEALEDPRIVKQKSAKKKLKMVARSLGWKGRRGTKKLTAAIEKVEGLSGNADALAKKVIEAKLSEGRIKGRLLRVTVDTRASDHVVAYVRWRGSKGKDAVKEASEIASVIAAELPMISTISLGAIHPKAAVTAKKLVWSAKISADSAANINPARIDDYADRLYKRLFEEVTARPF
jgi:hypothetical protein